VCKMTRPSVFWVWVMVNLLFILGVGWGLALMDGGHFIVAEGENMQKQSTKICQSQNPTFMSVFLKRPNVTFAKTDICKIVEKQLLPDSIRSKTVVKEIEIEKPKVEENGEVSEKINVIVKQEGKDWDCVKQEGKDWDCVKSEKEEATTEAPPVLDQIENPLKEEKNEDPKVVSSDKKPNVFKAIPIGDKNIAKSDEDKTTEDVDLYAVNEKARVHHSQPNSLHEETLEDDEEGVVIEENLPDNEEDKITFSKWAELKIKEEEEKKPFKNEKVLTHGDGVKTNIKINGLASSGARLKKNYASPDCGAKIVGANPGSQGSGNVITSSKDEYFLNKCTDKSWFIVELCESIKALKIEIANFELFSSSPKEFKVHVGNVFPGRESDWLEFGHFTYKDEKMLQNFKSDSGMVGKYVKVEIFSYHGTEHYCPVSVFKVFGISDIDLMSLDDTQDDDDDDGDDALEGEKQNSDNILFKTIKDAVDKVVNVFSRERENQTMSSTLNESSLNGATLRYDLVPESLYSSNIDHYHMIYYLMATKYGSLREYLFTMPIERVLQQRCAHFGVQFLNQNCNTGECGVGPWEWVRFLEAVHGEQFLLTLCNILSVEKGESDVSLASGIHGSDRLGENIGNDTNLEKEINLNVTNELQNDKDGKEEEVVAVAKEEKVDIKSEDSSSDVKIEIIVPQEEKVLVTEVPEILPVIATEGPKIAVPSHSEVPKTSGGTAQNTASQSTWQKLSNRIKALERNVTLSTGFLEELSLRYVKQIDELNLAVKAANDAIVATNKKQDLNRQTNEKLENKMSELTTTVVKLNKNMEKLQEEIMTRHGLLLLAEVLCLGLVLIACRPTPRTAPSPPPQASHAPSRRHSMESAKPPKEVAKLKRRQSIEVAPLSNGHFGSMVERTESEHLTKRQKKRRRRKGSRQEGLQHVQEDEGEEYEDDVYATFHGNSREAAMGAQSHPRQLMRSSSFSRLDESKFGSQESIVPMEGSRFSVEPVKITLEVKNSSPHYPQQMPPREHHYHHQVSSRDHHYHGEQHYHQEGGMYQRDQRSHSHIEVSNKFGLLNHSVHGEQFESDSEAEKTVFVFPKQKKFQRSKSKSPSRQPNLIAKQRKVLFKNFRPENADWLKNT